MMLNKYYICKTMMTSVDEIKNMIGVQVLFEGVEIQSCSVFLFCICCVVWCCCCCAHYSPVVRCSSTSSRTGSLSESPFVSRSLVSGPPQSEACLSVSPQKLINKNNPVLNRKSFNLNFILYQFYLYVRQFTLVLVLSSE